MYWILISFLNTLKSGIEKQLTTDEMLAAYELYSIDHDVTYEQFIEQYQQDCVNWENYFKPV